MCSCSRITRGDPPRKSSSPIRGAEYFRPLHKFKGVESVRKIETGLERGQRLWRKLRNTVLMHSMRRGDPPRKSSSPIRAAEYFRPLHKFIGVKSVWKIETGLECDQIIKLIKLHSTGSWVSPQLRELFKVAVASRHSS